MFDHGIYHWIKDFYLDEEGIPLKEKSNVERFFVLENGKPIWFDKREDAEAIYGVGDSTGILTFRALRAHVSDNKPLLLAQPGYESNLKSLPPIPRAIYYHGSWVARLEEAGYFKREWCDIVPFPCQIKCKRVRAWDTSATKVSPATPDPDWTRGTLISKDEKSTYTVEDIVSIRDRPHVVEQLIYSTAESDGPNVTVVIECDPGAAGIAYAGQIKSKLAEKGYYCKVIKSQKTKLTRFLPVSALAEAGRIQFVKSSWLDEALKELENFTGGKNDGHDDICDTMSTGIAALNQGVELPTMILPNILVSGQPLQSFHNSYGKNQGNFTLPTFNIK